MKETFAVGKHRPIYLWAGQTTVRMNRLKFMDAPVDEFVHEEAHGESGARRVLDTGSNWAYLMYDWGFPPEIERSDWGDFRQAVQVYQTHGIQVFGYVQTSNCVYDGSYKEKDWYARTPDGKKFHYYTGRYMACWRHPEWLAHLREIVRGIVESGADGVFFDNPWYATQPISFLDTWMGNAGCYCDNCRDAYRQFSGEEIPVRIAPGFEPASQTYLRWRAEQVTATLASLSAYARSLNPDVVISANDFDAVTRPSYVIYGIDLAGLANVQDVIMIEDFAMPKWDGDVLVNNALTLRTARALIGDTPLSTIPYDKGIGFDEVYKPRRFAQSIAEAAACGAAMVIKGTEFVEADGTFTLLTAEQYAPQREASAHINNWLTEKAALFEGRTNAARVGLLHPGKEMYWHWAQLAPLYFAAGQTLTMAGIPWRVVTKDDDIAGLDVLLTFDEPKDEGFHIPELAGWMPKPESYLDTHPFAHKVVSKTLTRLYRAYFESRPFRAFADKVGMEKLVLSSPFFKLPAPELQQTLLSALPQSEMPTVKSETPVLVEMWQKGTQMQIHLVNYAEKTTKVTVTFGATVPGKVLSPDTDEIRFEGDTLELGLDVYSILTWQA